MEFNYTIEKHDFTQATVLKRKAKPHIIRHIIFILLGFFICNMAITGIITGWDFFDIVILLIGIALIFDDLTTIFFMKIVAGRIYCRNKAIMGNTIKTEIKEDGIYIEAQDGKSFYGWERFINYMIDKSLILLYISSDLALTIPSRTLNQDEYNRFMSFLETKIKKKKSNHWITLILRALQIIVFLWVVALIVIEALGL